MANELCDRLIDYFNGDLDEQEKRIFEEHLQECAECREELEELKALTEDLPFVSEPVDPPDGMKERILTNVFAEEEESPTQRHTEPRPVEPTPLSARREKKSNQRKMNWWMPLLAAALLLSLVGNAFSLFNENSGNSGQGIQVASAMKTVQLKGTGVIKNSQGSATMVKTDTGGVRVVVSAKDLKQLQGSKVYQVWLIDGKTPYRAGTFIPDQDGAGAVAYTMNLPKYHTWDQVAISLEPTKNSKTPQGKIILAGAL